MNGRNGFFSNATDIRLLLRTVSPDMAAKTKRCLISLIVFACLFPLLIIAFVIVMETVGGKIEFEKAWIPIVSFFALFFPTIACFILSMIRYVVCRQIMNFMLRVKSFDRVEISQLWFSVPDGIILAQKLIETGNLSDYEVQGSSLVKIGERSYSSSFCPSCGREVEEDDVYCKACGKRLK